MRNCINVERRNLLRREEDLRNAVYGIETKEKEIEVKDKVKVEEMPQKVYM